MSFDSYQIGTVSVANNGTTVTLVGGSWLSPNAKEGDNLFIEGKAAGRIKTVANDGLSCTINTWANGVKSGVAYWIEPDSPLRFEGMEAFNDYVRVIKALSTDGYWVFVKPGGNPLTEDGYEGQYAVDPSDGRSWVRASGAWGYRGKAAGQVIDDQQWSETTTYAAGIIVPRSGTLYKSLVHNNLNFPPESNPTYWVVWNVAVSQASRQLTPGWGSRLSLSSTAALTTADILAANTLFVKCVEHSLTSIFDGTTSVIRDVVDGTPIILDPFHHAPGYIYSVWEYWNGTSVAYGFGTPWTNDTTMDTYSQIDMVDGRPVNKVAFNVYNNGVFSADIPARRANYLGCVRIREDIAGVIDDSQTRRHLSNMYHAEKRYMFKKDQFNWTYSGTTIRQANANALNKLDFVCCDPSRLLEARVSAKVQNNTSTFRAGIVTIGIDSATINTSTYSSFVAVNNTFSQETYSMFTGYPGLGRHTAVWQESGEGADTLTWILGRIEGTILG